MHFIWSSFTSIVLICILISMAKANSNDTREHRKSGVMLLRILPNTTEQFEYLKSLKHSKQGLKLQLWRHPDKINRHVDLWLSWKSYDNFEQLCSEKNLTFEIVHSNIYDVIAKENISMNNIEVYENFYQGYEEIEGELKRLNFIFNSSTILEVIGKSYEGRNIYAFHIRQNASEEKPIIFINCGTHAREWLGISSCQYTMRRALFDRLYDEQIDMMLNEFDLIFVPVLNPDGYIFSHRRRYRLWRKSRSPTPQGHCFGVDLNRNFDYRWGGGGSSQDPCEEIYCGTKPFSENESLALARYLYKHRRKIVSFLDVHTFGQMWMSPWGYTNLHPRDHDRQRRMMEEIQRAIEQEGGVRYRIGTSSTTLYQTSGDALDWVYGRLGIVYTFGLELRPSLRASRGFRHTRHAIVPTGKDLLTGLKTIAHVLLNERNARSN